MTTKPFDPVADIARCRANGMTLRSISIHAGVDTTTVWRLANGGAPSLSSAVALQKLARESAAIAARDTKAKLAKRRARA